MDSLQFLSVLFGIGKFTISCNTFVCMPLEKWNAEKLGCRLKLPRVKQLPRSVQLLLAWHWHPNHTGEHVYCCRICTERCVHRQPHCQEEPQVSACGVEMKQAHQPRWRWWCVQTQTARTSEGCGDRECHYAYDVKVVSACRRLFAQILDVFTKLASLGARHLVDESKSGPSLFHIEAVVGTVPIPQPHGCTSSSGTRQLDSCPHISTLKKACGGGPRMG
mmetsp:Transcript_25448/g.40228  ORF Transcript_25448/g.40228 Transcript_25448/m.40228 type:complete len:220 (-) Transcript_25448:98-757(-)